MFHSLRSIARPFSTALLLGLLAATLCLWLKTPLPWMIGPLLATAAARMSGHDLRCPVQAREAGQWAIGTALGLYFTPTVLKVLASYIGFIIVAVVFALVLGMVCGWLLHKLTGVDQTTAFFSRWRSAARPRWRRRRSGMARRSTGSPRHTACAS
ncbi:AbrB family transcriptional regulator [Undibacterium arcticum]